MSATEAEKASLRRQVDADSTMLSDAEIDALWAEAEGLYPDYVDNRHVIFAVVRLATWRILMVSASKRVDYMQNQSEEKLSQLLKNMTVIEAQFTRQLESLLTSFTLPSVRFGRMAKRKGGHPNA